MESIKRLILCLGYPNSDTFDISKKSSVANLVIWLEDRKIRELEISERESLRNYKQGEWNDEMAKYLERLGCSLKWLGINGESTVACLNWLVSTAVSLEYEDRASECVDMEVNCVEMETDSFSKCAEEINELGDLIGLQRNLDELDHEFLRRLSSRIRLLLTPGSIASLSEAQQEMSTDDTSAMSGLSRFSLEFDVADAVVQQIAVVLKMLYLADFRDLQTELNCLIVLGQEYTANPRTNSSLGKVGR
mmetsp:Transcript_494/g.1159  ORF Transcript_494/g.1159 Transcript_494/m.1159 type:complete len:248 (+) Transcript_494:73-816(+)